MLVDISDHSGAGGPRRGNTNTGGKAEKGKDPILGAFLKYE